MVRCWNSSIVRVLFRGAVITVLAGILASPLLAQKNNAPPTFLIGTVAGDPGTSASIPLYFTPNASQPVHSIHLEVTFVSNSVKFDKAEKGTASAVQDFDLKVASTELPPEQNLQHTKLDIQIGIADSDTKKTLPEGLLAFLNFNVPDNAKSFAIELKPVVIAALEPGKKPVKVSVEPGKIIVALPDAPMPGCFFFTH